MTESATNSAASDPGDVATKFRRHWQMSTDDNNLTLHGFRRFKTSHLVNLRFLEEEIAQVDHIIYQAGLSLEPNHSPTDRLGLRHTKRDANTLPASSTITREFVLNLRDLMRQYGM